MTVYATTLSKIFGQKVGSLAAGQAVNLDVRGMKGFAMTPGAGATVTYSRIDSMAATAHGATSATTTAFKYQDAEWPFYRVSTAGGSAVYARV